MKAVIYVRVSTTDQDYARQIEDLQNYANRNGYEVVKILEEKESGFNDERPEFNKLLKYTKHDVDIILVWELTRLSRRSILLQSTVRSFMDKGIQIYAYKENFNSHNPDGTESEVGKVVLAMLATMAETEAKTLKARTMAGRFHSVVNKGKSYSPVGLYGYDMVDGKMVINEKQAENVRKVFQLCIEGESFWNIGLTMKALDTEKEKLWQGCGVKFMLHNPTYKGERLYKSKCGKEAVITTPAIVTPEVWEEAQRCIASRKVHRSEGRERRTLDYMLKGLIVCGVCGKRFTCSAKIYKCITAANRAYDRCGNTTVSQPALDAIVWNVIEYFFANMISQDYNEEKKLPLEEAKIELQTIIDGLNTQIENTKKSTAKYIELMGRLSTGSSSIDTILSKITKNDEDIKDYQSKISEKYAEIALIDKKLKAMDEQLDYKITEATEKAEFAHKVISVVKVFGSRSKKVIQVHFNSGDVIDIVYLEKKWYFFTNDEYISYSSMPAKKDDTTPEADRDNTIAFVMVGDYSIFKPEEEGDEGVKMVKLNDLLPMLKEMGVLQPVEKLNA